MAVPPVHIFLVGFSGSGKSSVGKQLSKRLKRPFIDTDTLIERRHRMSINDIFVEYGERQFREWEREAVVGVCERRALSVVALGGGAFVSPQNRRFLKKHGITIWLTCSIREIYRRVRSNNDRPLLGSKPMRGETERQARLRTMAHLLEKRIPRYRLADMKVATSDRTVPQVVAEITRRLRQEAA